MESGAACARACLHGRGTHQSSCSAGGRLRQLPAAVSKLPTAGSCGPATPQAGALFATHTALALHSPACSRGVHTRLSAWSVGCMARRFISEFLQSLPADTRRALATVARLEPYKKDQVRVAVNMLGPAPCQPWSVPLCALWRAKAPCRALLLYMACCSWFSTLGTSPPTSMSPSVGGLTSGPTRQGHTGVSMCLWLAM